MVDVASDLLADDEPPPSSPIVVPLPGQTAVSPEGDERDTGKPTD
jgi:hypothetical protein